MTIGDKDICLTESTPALLLAADKQTIAVALADARHMLLECPALAGLRLRILFTLAVLFRQHEAAPVDQHEVCRYIIACL